MDKIKEDKLNVWKVNSNLMNSKRTNHSNVGITNDCMIMGGWNGTSHLNTTEVYNGTIWSNSTNMNSIRHSNSSVGISSDCMVMGGYNGSTRLNTTEVYNGSIWSNSTNMNSIRYDHSSVGITNNSMVMGGRDNNTYLNTTEVYNGSIWSNSTNMNSIRCSHSSVGITNNGMVIGGWNDNARLNTTEVYNGSIWSNSTNMNSIRHSHSSVGITNNSMVMGGYNNGAINTTEVYNGSIWFNSTNMNSIRYSHSGVGISSDCMVIGGRDDIGNITNTTEIYMSIYPILLNNKEEIIMAVTHDSENRKFGSINVKETFSKDLANNSKSGNENIYLTITTEPYAMGCSLRLDLTVNLDGEKTYSEVGIYGSHASDCSLKILVETDTDSISVDKVKIIVKDVLKMIGNINSSYSTVNVKQISKDTFKNLLRDDRYRVIKYHSEEVNGVD